MANTESDISGIKALTVRKDGVTAVRTVAGDAMLELAALPGHTAQLTGTKNGAARWNIRMGDATTETGGNTGSDFWLFGVDDAAATVTASGITINRKLGNIGLGGNTTVSGTLTANGYISTLADLTVQRGGAPTTGYMFLGNSGTRYLGWDGTQFAFNGPLIAGATSITGTLAVAGVCTVNNSIVSALDANNGAYYFGSSFSKSITVSGGQFHFNGGSAWFGAVNASVDAPCAAGTAASGAWPMGVSAVDRGILFMQASGSNLVLYFTQGSTANAVGSVNTSSVATVYNTASSAELKEDLKSFDAGNIIDQTNVYDFAWKKSGERSCGVIAQQAIDVYPMAVTHTEVKVPDGEVSEFWGVDYSKYVPVLLQELKALRARVFELEGRVGVGTNPA